MNRTINQNLSELMRLELQEAERLGIADRPAQVELREAKANIDARIEAEEEAAQENPWLTNALMVYGAWVVIVLAFGALLLLVQP